MQQARQLGYRTNPNLPLLSDAQPPRGQTEVVERVLVVGALLSGVLGDYPSDVLSRWLSQHRLWDAATLRERGYFSGDPLNERDLTDFRDHVESANALCWVLGRVSTLDFGTEVDDSLGALLPNIEAGEGPAQFIDAAQMRDNREVLAMCDLSYCLHWAIVDAHLNGREAPGQVEPCVVVYRRRALEWVLSRDDWDDVAMDT